MQEHDNMRTASDQPAHLIRPHEEALESWLRIECSLIRLCELAV